MSFEISTGSIENIVVAGRTIELVRPITDSVCSPDDAVKPQVRGEVEMVYMAREEGPCGGVEMAEAVMDRMIAWRDTHDPDIGIFANHPPSKGAERGLQYQQAGVHFDIPIEEIPAGSIYLFSAHGADPREVKKARDAGLHVVDTTCPLVGTIYRQIERMAPQEEEGITLDKVGVVYLATTYNPDHPEISGTRGVVEDRGMQFLPVTTVEEAVALADGAEGVGPEHVSLRGLERIGVTGVTTNNSDVTQEVADALVQRLQEQGAEEGFVRPYNSNSVCHTVKYRQEAIRQMVSGGLVETVIVVGALSSNNTNELVSAVLDEAAKHPETTRLGRVIYANTHHDVPRLTGAVGIVSGASTQQLNIDQIIIKLGADEDSLSYLGKTDKVEMFKPLGGAQSLARRALDADFSWIQ